MYAITRKELCQMLPHGEDMCLLHAVDWWNESAISCIARSHRDPNNPLRRNNVLESVCGVEYAAQAMAIHIRLTNPEKSMDRKMGYVGAIREMIIHSSTLDGFSHHLEVSASVMITQGANYMYAFRVTTLGEDILSGRASVFIQDQKVMQ